MRRIGSIGLAAAVALFGVACDTGEDADLELPDQPVGEPTVETGDVGEPGAMGAALGVDSLQGTGQYLTDAAGRALYLLEGEPTDSTTCFDACAEEWPPFLASPGSPSAEATVVQLDLIGTIERPDGQTQVTYDGHPLYYYHGDEGPGETAGQDVTDQWGEWYLVRPEGGALEG